MRSHARFSRLAGVLLLVAFAAETTVARAQVDEAADLLLRAFELRRQHRNEEALAIYGKAIVLSPTPAARAQRGLAEQALARWTLAEQDLEFALASDDPWVARNRASLDGARLVVRQHLAWLTVDVDVAGAEIRLEGEPIAAGSETRVLAGVGVLEVRAAGYVPDVRRVSFAPAEHIHRTVSLAPLVAAAPPVASLLPPEVPESSSPPPEALTPRAAEGSPEGRSAVPAVPIALGVFGAAGIATGVYFGVRTFEKRNDERTHCIGRCTDAASRDYWDAQTSASVSTVATIAGIGLVVGGGVLWLLGRGRTHPASALEVTPVLGVGMNGLVLRGSL